MLAIPKTPSIALGMKLPYTNSQNIQPHRINLPQPYMLYHPARILLKQIIPQISEFPSITKKRIWQNFSAPSQKCLNPAHHGSLYVISHTLTYVLHSSSNPTTGWCLLALPLQWAEWRQSIWPSRKCTFNFVSQKRHRAAWYIQNLEDCRRIRSLKLKKGSIISILW